MTCVHHSAAKALRHVYDSRAIGGTTFSPVTSSFAYNSHGEVASAVIGDNDETYEYDFAGNSIAASYNS